MRALVVGATGAVGGAVVRALLAEAECESVTALVRRPTDAFDRLPSRDRLDVIVTPFDQLESAAASSGARHTTAFCTMGIGQPRKVAAEDFWRVDVTYAGAFARGAAAAGLQHISLLSSVGADAESRSWYLRVKGAAELAVIEAGLPRTSLFRPSLLITPAVRYGAQDIAARTVFPLVSPLLPSKYHQISVERLGMAMVRNALRPGAGVAVLHYAEFRELLNEAPPQPRRAPGM
jgi:uncharacterized protein YbjT (DUF2867 family)